MRWNFSRPFQMRRACLPRGEYREEKLALDLDKLCREENYYESFKAKLLDPNIGVTPLLEQQIVACALSRKTSTTPSRIWGTLEHRIEQK